MLPWCARALFLVSLASAGAGADAATVDTEVSVPVQVVTAKSIEESPTCGRVLSHLVNIAPAPMLNIGRSILTLPAGADTTTLIDNLQIRTSDGKLHPASSPICVEDIQVLKGPAEAIYGNDAVAGVINFVTSPYSGPRPLDSTDYTSNFYAEPFLNPAQVQIIRGPFDAQWPGTSVDVNGKPGLILAETPQALFWLLPDDAPSGSVSITVTDAGRGARFPVYILGLAMSADRLKLLRGESTRMQATVFGPELIPADQWKAGDMSWTLDLKKIGQLFPDFKIPRPGEPASLFFRIENVSRDTVSMKPSKNESFIVNLNRSSFASGPYTYGATIQSKKAGGFTINGLVVGFFAPIPGEPLPPAASSATGTAGDPGTGTASPPSPGPPEQTASQP